MPTGTLNISVEEKALLDQVALAQHRSEGELAASALRSYLKFEAEQIRKIRDGIAAADLGQFATDEEVETFFAKYTGGE